MILIASIAHSGTHFVGELLDYPYQNESRCGEQFARSMHTYPDGLGLLHEAVKQQAIVVAPLRHPWAIAQSWANRGKRISRHPSQPTLVDVMRCMIDDVAPHVTAWLPLDVPDRDVYLRTLSVIVGKDLKTDWEPRGHHPVHRDAIMPDYDKLAIEEILQDPFWERFGYHEQTVAA